MRSHGGSVAATDETFLVSPSLQMFADDLGIPVASLRTYRWVAARWPAAHRQPKVSYGIHKILASISDETQRYATITDPAPHTRSGERRWTEDAALREVGQQVEHPVTVQEKVERSHDSARDEQVAAAVATDLLRRPEVAFKAMADTTARHLVNRAQVDQAWQAGEVVRQRTPALPRVEQRRAIRLRACPNPVAGVIDSQSVRAAATVTGRSRSYDADKGAGEKEPSRRGHLRRAHDGHGHGRRAARPRRCPRVAGQVADAASAAHPVWGDSAYAGGVGPPRSAPHLEDRD